MDSERDSSSRHWGGFLHRFAFGGALVARGAAVRVVDDLSSGRFQNIREHIELNGSSCPGGYLR